jgi:hypothetical protein
MRKLLRTVCLPIVIGILFSCNQPSSTHADVADSKRANDSLHRSDSLQADSAMLHKHPVLESKTFKKGDIIEPLKAFDFSLPNSYAMLNISGNDFEELPSSIKKSALLKITDPEILKQIQMEFWFIYTGTDMTTCESSISFCSGNKTVFKSEIVIENNKVGLQGHSGWIEAVDSKKIIDLIARGAKVYTPELKL